MARYIPLLLGAALFVSGLSGCGAVMRDTHHEVQSHSQDGALGITEANPNMPLSATYHTYQDDVRLIQTAVRDHFPAVRSSTVSLNGPVARVRLYVPVGMSAEDQARLKQEAADELAREMPRYRVEVSVAAK